MTTDEPLARRMILVQAIETGDTQGKLLSPVERDEIDRLALQSATQGAPAVTAHVEAFLRERTQQVLRVLENRDPALALLQQRSPWARRLATLAFVAAVVFGAATDRIANPHRVDLLSLPLLLIVAWNLLIYGALIASYVLQRRSHKSTPSSASLMQWAEGWRGWHGRAGQLRTKVTAEFIRRWYSASAALNAQRWRKVLHLAAAGWALGIALSLFTRGLVVEYRVGWESTFLDASQVHAILRLLLMPAMALFPFQPFSVQDIAGLQFSQGNGAVAGARWVYIYVTLLAVVVMVPRLALALFAGWRERVLSRRIVLPLTGPYYQRLLAMLNPTRVQLGVLALRAEDSAALLRVLRPRAPALPAFDHADGRLHTLVRTNSGEELCMASVPLSCNLQPPPQVNKTASGWAGRTFGRLLQSRSPASERSVNATPVPANDDSDVLLVVLRDADDIDSALPSPPGPGQPTLLLVNAEDAEAAVARCRAKARSLGLSAEVLGFDRLAQCWVQDSTLFHAITRCLPNPKKEGFTRLANIWLQRNDERFARSMQVIATQLLDAAREVEAVNSALPFVKRLISSTDRLADAQARKDAMAAVVERLQQSARQTHAELLRLHGIDEAAGALLEQPLIAQFNVQSAINRTEAGLAGAATGAASGASIDLVTGGLTLGAAAALGALIGGGAGFAGAAWKNRASPTGTTRVQLRDEMLQAMAQLALLRYLAVCRLYRGLALPIDSEGFGASQVTAAFEAKKERLARFWADARSQQDTLQATAALADELQAMMREVLRRLYPTAPG
jgi:Domain of unknown function (DUF3482)/Protein of unknown function (DUF2868)